MTKTHNRLQVSMERNPIQLVSMCGLPLHAAGHATMARWIIQQCLAPASAGPLIVAHINIHNLFVALHEPALHAELKHNAHLLFDGIGLKIAAGISGHGWHPDLNGTDIFSQLMRDELAGRLRVFLLGTDAETLRRTVETVRREFPRINVVGSADGFFAPGDDEKIVARINAAHPDLLLVGRGFGLQERFSIRNRGRLTAKVIWSVGGLFDTISGKKPRAPAWMRVLRLEWLYRFLLEPGRMWKRNFISAPVLLVYFALLRLRPGLRMRTLFPATDPSRK
jgi:exopolysaccharide biosynthesis WecB/TagA/CpsF family protein